MSLDFRLIAFDLDDTLAPSKSPAPDEIIDLLARLLTHVHVAVISGGNLEQFTTQLLDPLEKRLGQRDAAEVESLLTRMHLLPTCGTRYYTRTPGGWAAEYEENLSFEDRALASQTLERKAQELGLWEALTWGEIIEDRGSQVTFSALGQRAPVEAKALWDPSGTKKNALREAVAAELTHLEVRSGGSTSIDITRKGIDKAYGMRKLEEQTGIRLDDMFFVGDRLDPDGNDYPVKALGVRCQEVGGWEETVTYLTELLAQVEATA